MNPNFNRNIFNRKERKERRVEIFLTGASRDSRDCGLWIVDCGLLTFLCFLCCLLFSFGCFAQSIITADGLAAFGTNAVSGGGGGGVTFTRVQFKHVYPASAATFTANVTAGNFVVVSISNSGNTPYSAATDGLANSYTRTESEIVGGNESIAVFTSLITHSGACTITCTGGGSDPGITMVEYHGPTAVDAHGNGGGGVGTNPSVSLTTDAPTMFFAAWGHEFSNAFTSTSLTPGSIAGTVIQHDASHWDAQVEWLNSGAGFSSGTYSASLTGTGMWIALALK
jgi:hypothetical protein